MKTKYKIWVVFVGFFLLSNRIFSQENTLYFMKNNVQRIDVNPAYQPECKYFLELPILSSVQLAYNNTGFGYNDIIAHGTGNQADSLIFDIDNLATKLKKVNHIRTDLRFNILGFGAKINETYISFNISNHTEMRVGFPRDIINFKDGNWNLETDKPIPLDFSGIGIDAINYTSIGLTASQNMGYIQVGATAKLLLGGVNFNTQRTNIWLETENNPIALAANTDILLNASMPLNVAYTADGYIESVNTNFTNPVSDFLLTGNKGVALDFGLMTQPTDNMTFALSVTDIGLIGWKNNESNFTANGYFRFVGFDFTDYQTNYDGTALVDQLKDSLLNAFQFENANNSYSSFLMPKVYAGLDYELNEKVSFGAVGKILIYDKQFDPSFTLSVNARPLPFLSTTLSYSVMNRSFKNLGFALGIGSKGAQLYLISDNIPINYVKDVSSGLMLPYAARTLNFRLGLNIIFGCGEGNDRNKGSKSNTYCPAYGRQ